MAQLLPDHCRILFTVSCIKACSQDLHGYTAIPSKTLRVSDVAKERPNIFRYGYRAISKSEVWALRFWSPIGNMNDRTKRVLPGKMYKHPPLREVSVVGIPDITHGAARAG